MKYFGIREKRIRNLFFYWDKYCYSSSRNSVSRLCLSYPARYRKNTALHLRNVTNINRQITHSTHAKQDRSKDGGWSQQDDDLAFTTTAWRRRSRYDSNHCSTFPLMPNLEICPGLHANAKIAILAKNRKNRKHRKSVAIFAILTIFAKIAKIAKNRKNRKNSQKLEKTSPPKVLRFLRF